MQETLHALYLHIPFCLRKCSYCDFYSVTSAHPEKMQAYSRRLAERIRIWGAALPDAYLDTVYFGGGTPSLLSEGMMEEILEAIHQSFRVAPDAEISMEANPATMSLNKAKGFFQSGINRISLGVQSFVPEELKTLGRLHNVKAVLETVEAIHQAGFSNYNLDLIYGVPGQTLKTWEYSLQQALACKPDHLSLYLLQMDKQVPLYRQIERGEKVEPEENQVVRMFYRGDEILQDQGYEHYEISNFAAPGKSCRHHLHYWQSHPYLGLGAGAVSFLDGKRFRLSNDVQSFFIDNCVPGENFGECLEELKTVEQRLSDALIMGLRCMKGVSAKEFKERFGIDIYERYAAEIFACEQEGLLERKQGFLCLTRRGWFLSNQVLWRFV